MPEEYKIRKEEKKKKILEKKIIIKGVFFLQVEHRRYLGRQQKKKKKKKKKTANQLFDALSTIAGAKSKQLIFLNSFAITGIRRQTVSVDWYPK